MLVSDVVQPLLLLALVILVTPPLGAHIARVMEGERTFLHPLLGPVERITYRALRLQPEREQAWRPYGRAMLAFSIASIALLYLLQRIQGVLPLNPDGHGAVPPYLALNTAVSFVTNTNWQNYLGEQTMSHLTQLAGLAVQNFASAAVGMAIAIALVRGIARRRSQTIGNFWADLVRGVLYVLLPLSFVLALVLLGRGVVQNFHGFDQVSTVTGQSQRIPGGPVASQEAIKELGTNGGGFYNANSAHPFENPDPLTNFLEVLALLAVPGALTATYGRMVGSRRQGWAIFAVMFLLWGISVAVAVTAEQQPNPDVARTGVDQHASALQAGGNMEGKEVRFGIGASGTFAASTTGTSTGAVNSFHDSYTALGGMMPMINMMLGEVAPGGVGSGLYGMLILAVVTVFVAGLMVGRTPEYLGKKIGSREIKFAAMYFLITPICVLVGTAAAMALPGERAGMLNRGPHGLSEVLYAFTSASNNNGSAFAGITAGTAWYDTALGLAMAFGRFLPMIFVLALAGSLAGQGLTPESEGTLPTHRPQFVGMVAGVTVILVALTFLPALALGPLAEGIH
jgi:potassium-transporting ATPase potassium-binding subunit